MAGFDLVVVGGGVAGTATALAAARRGLRTLLLEQFELGHQHGSSHGPSRIIRLAYHTVDYITLARESFDRWRALEAASGRSLLRTTGGLDCARPGTASLEATIAAMRAADVPVEALDFDDLVARYPQIRFEPGMHGVFQPDAAVLDADVCVRTLAEQACRHGVEIRERSQVRSAESTAAGVRVAVNGGEVHAAAVVIAAGSWTNRVLTGLRCALPLRVTREQVCYFAGSQDFEVGRFPLVLEHFPDHPPLAAAFPRLPPHGWAKLMFHTNGPTIDPEDLSGEVDRTAQSELVGYASRRFPGLGPVTQTQTCRYTMTPDEDFVMDLVPGCPRVGVVSACSGHGFKFGPVLGEAMVDLVTTGSSDHLTGRFAIERPMLTLTDPETA